MGIMLGDIEHDVWLGDVEQDVFLGDVQQNEVDAGFDFGNALNFNSIDTDDYVKTLNNGTYTNTWTVSYWFNFRETAGTIFGTLNDASGVGYIGYLLSSNQIRILSPVVSNFTVQVMTANTWYHCMISCNAGVANLWLNGVKSINVDLAATGLIKFELLGQRRVALGLPFKGMMDELGYKLNYVGTEQNAIDLYNGGDGADFASVIGSNDLHYDLNQSGNDTEALDLSGNANTGTLTNFDFVESPWIDHFTGVPSALNANVASHTYTYHGSDTDAFLDLFIATADQVTTGRTIDLSGNTISPYALAIITDLIDNYQVNVIT